MLLEEAARYEVADPEREVIPAFELIATVAQRIPGDDGTYILDTDIKALTEWVNYAADHDLLVFLDLQNRAWHRRRRVREGAVTVAAAQCASRD